MNPVQPIQEISPHKLFDVLQKEYLICILRSKIYPIKKHSEYWAKLAVQKKDKICHLKGKYSLLSIFDDDKILKMYERNTYNEYGLPNFYYPNDKVKDNQAYWDVKNYYSAGHTIRFINQFGKQCKGIIKECDLQNRTIKNDTDEELSFDVVSRIL